MTAYTDSGKIAAFLGATLTSPQATQAGVVAAAASDFIEKALDRSWLGWTSSTAIAVTAERQTIRGCRLRLDHTPVAAITSLTVRRPTPGYTPAVLVAPTQYELVDAAGGHVYVSPTADGMLATISYTSTEPTPAIIGQFATELAAGMLTLSLAGAAASQAALAGIRRYTLWGGDLSVEYAASASAQDGAAPGSTRLPALWSQIEGLFSRRLAVV